uniref:BTB/POZ domain-containing protein n=1 Tax=Schistosoma curassoni TaxID=6186 RepID=A0A183KEG8_9TREM
MGIFFNNLTSGIYLGRDGSHFRFSTDSAITSIRPLSVLHTSALRESLKSTLVSDWIPNGIKWLQASVGSAGKYPIQLSIVSNNADHLGN